MTLIADRYRKPLADFAITRSMNTTPTLQPNKGDSYRPTALNEVDQRPMFTKAGTKAWADQREVLRRPTLVSDRDPVVYALMVDALMRMEHDHTITSKELANFLDQYYPAFIWNTVMVGRMLANLAEASKVPNEGSPAIEGKRDSNRWFYRVRTDPRSWRWLGHMRDKLGKLAEQTLAREAVERNGTLLWDEFPWDMARMS